MAAAVLQSAKVHVPHPFQRITTNPPSEPSSSRCPRRSPSPDVFISTSSTSEAPSRSFHRLRLSLEQGLRTATRSKKLPSHLPVDEFATVSAKANKGKEKETNPNDVRKEKDMSKMLYKVTFRRAGRDSLTSSSIPPVIDAGEKVRQAGFTSFITPSLRQASMSSPALHLSSQALPSPKSQSAVPASSSSGAEALVSPARQRTRRTTLQPQPQGIDVPLPSAVKLDPQIAPPEGSKGNVSHHRSTKSNPPPMPTSPLTTTLAFRKRDSLPDTPTAATLRRDIPSPLDTPTPPSISRTSLTRAPSRTNTTSPVAGRASTPIRARSPSNRVRVVTPSKYPTSVSASHLPISSSPPASPRRPSVDSKRRTSGETARRPSIDSPRRPRDSPSDIRAESPSPIRPRPISPAQRSYAQNRHYNISSGSLVLATSNPEHRELIRTATSMLCKEIVKPPPHMGRTQSGIKDWEEVEIRTRSLARLERIWKNGNLSGASSGGTSSSALVSSGLSASGEERERRLFCEALKDGFVLCQLMNKLRSSSVVRPDSREDGFVRTSNITKFLAACASHGLPSEDLFQRDDLIEGSSESLARVAKTIIALIKFVDSPAPSRSKYLSGQSKLGTLNPYPQGTVSRGSASTPNLIPTSTAPPPNSPTRKRWSPPADLPTVRSSSPEDGFIKTPKMSVGQRSQNDVFDGDEVKKKPLPVPPLQPPPKSPLRKRSSKQLDAGGLFSWARAAASPMRSSIADSTRASVGDASIRESITDEPNVRQSVASTAVTESTLSTALSSVMDFGRSSSGGNKFSTIRTVTTDLTSEAPSISRTEGSAIAEDLARKQAAEIVGKFRERKLSEVRAVDLSRVAEETDESVSSKGHDRNRRTERRKPMEKPAVHLRKGKWPDDFIDAFQTHNLPRPIPPPSNDEDISSKSTPISIPPPRKIAIVEANRRNESLEVLPRKPTHRPRHSIDTPVLTPKESILRRDSPDSAASSSGRIMLRRHSTKPGVTQRVGTCTPQSYVEGQGPTDSASVVPFPRTTSGERDKGAHSPIQSSLGGERAGVHERPRLIRGRFQSDVEGSSARRSARPNSYDELAVQPVRSRFESMINLGVASGTASASDLLSRDSMDGRAIRMTLIVREDGKPPTHFQLGNCIGRGQFGTVYRALNLNTGQMVAVKRIRLEGLKEEEVMTLMREVDLVKSLSHPSIVKYEGMARDDDTLNIVLEYAENGSLGQILKAFGKLNERLVGGYVVKILEGLHYLHTSDVVHCDLKAANILTTKNGNVKLSDFGVSLNLRAMEREMKDVAGTPNWMAPEVIELKGASTKSDIWSLGCTVIELLTGRPPYAEISNSMSVMFRIVEDDMPPVPEGCSPLLQDFLTQCFHKDPTRRPSAEMLCEHPWLKKNWGALKELRPQDSIPFLRRVSTDLQKSDELARYLSQVEKPDSPAPEGIVRGDAGKVPPIGRRTSNASVRPLPDSDISLRDHSFVKTTFSKPMICRVCQLSVKKNAVLCAQCSLVSHPKCAVNAPPTCDLRAQLLLYAHYAEKGNPANAYSNPAELLQDLQATMSDVAYSTSIDTPPQSATHIVAPELSPPTAFRFMAAFKRSRSNLSPEPGVVGGSSSLPSSSTVDAEEKAHRRRPAVLQRRGDRPISVTSDSTGVSSLRSAATAAESFSSQQDTGPRSHTSPAGPEKEARPYGSKLFVTGGSDQAPEVISDHGQDGVPGALSPLERRHMRGSKSASNCVVQ